MKQGILIVNHGTVLSDVRERTIDEMALSIKDRFEDAEVGLAFTDADVRRALREKGEKVQNVKAAMLSMKDAGVTNLYVILTDMIDDAAGRQTGQDISSCATLFSEVKATRPLLTRKEDVEICARALHGAFGRDVGNDIFIVVHPGDEEDGNEELEDLENALKTFFGKKAYVATIAGKKRMFHVLQELKNSGTDEGRVVLVPLEFMAGEDVENVVSREFNDLIDRLAFEGYDVVYDFKGLGEYEPIQRIYLKHLYEVMNI